MSREAMQMALDMLNEIADDVYCDQKLEGVISALRQALVDANDISQDHVDETTKQEHEPVAWIDQRIHGWPDCFVMQPDPPHTVPLYTAPPKCEWVGLTDEEFKFIASKYSLPTQTGMEYFKDELEAKLKEKNT